MSYLACCLHVDVPVLMLDLFISVLFFHHLFSTHCSIPIPVINRFTKKLSPDFHARLKRAQNNLKKAKTKKNTASMDAKQKAVQAHLDKIARDEARAFRWALY